MEYLQREIGPARQQPSAPGELGLHRRRCRPMTTIPQRARQLLEQAGYPRDQRRPLSPHHEDVHRRKHAPDGGRAAAAAARRWESHSIFATFEFATFFADVHPRAPSSSIPCAGSAATKIPTFSSTSSTPPNSAPNGANRGYLRRSRGGRADRSGPPANSTENTRKQLYAEVQRTPGRRTALHQSVVFRQRSGALQASQQPHAESVRQLRLSENSRTGRSVVSRRSSASEAPARSRLTRPTIASFTCYHRTYTVPIMHILFIGDIFGRPGRNIVQRPPARHWSRSAPSIWSSPTEKTPPAASASRPRWRKTCSTWASTCITTGNHIWDKREIIDYFQAADGNPHSPARRLLRPANYPADTAGLGSVRRRRRTVSPTP